MFDSKNTYKFIIFLNYVYVTGKNDSIFLHKSDGFIGVRDFIFNGNLSHFQYKTPREAIMFLKKFVKNPKIVK